MKQIKLNSLNELKKKKNWQIKNILHILVIYHYLIFSNFCLAQSTDPLVSDISLKDLSAFEHAPESWHIVGDVYYEPYEENIAKEEKGIGILINNPTTDLKGNLLTNMEHGDMDLEFDFMLPKGSSSAIYLQGRYGIRLNDSWSEVNSMAHASGAIYQSSVDNKQTTQTIPPRVNVCRAPGLWQNLKIFFQAPEFDNTGKKVSNARFRKVIYNGLVIHENIEVLGANFQSLSGDEKPLGPLMFTGNGGIAIRNIKYKIYENDQSEIKEVTTSSLSPGPWERPIIVTPEKGTIVQRCFIEYDQKKRTFCVAVGEPGQIHYAMDLSQGAIINLWKGKFINATTMWTGRGQEQIAHPLGSEIELSRKPAFAILQNKDEAWPDSMEHKNNYHFKGYQLDEHGRPTFKYLFKGVLIEDKITPENNDKYLTRTLRINSGNDIKDLWFRLAESSQIELLPDGLYGIDDKSYYIKVDSSTKEKPLIRKIKDGEELLIPAALVNDQDQLKYSIIW